MIVRDPERARGAECDPPWIDEVGIGLFRRARDIRDQVALNIGEAGGDGCDLVNDAAGSIGRGAGHQRVEFALGILSEAVNCESAGQDGAAAELEQGERLDHAGLQVGIENPAIGADGRGLEREITEDILSVKFGNGGSAIHKAAGDGDAFIVIILQRSLRACDWIDETCREANTAISRGGSDGAGVPAGAIGPVEEVIPLLDWPAIIAAKGDAVDLLNVVLTDLALNEFTIKAIEGKPIGIAETEGVGFGNLTGALEWIGRGDAILAVGTDRVGTPGVQAWEERVKAQHFAERCAQVLGVATRFNMARADVVRVAAVAQCEIHVTVRAERNRSTIMVVGVFPEGDDLAAGGRIHDVLIGTGDLPLVDHILVTLGGIAWCHIGGCGSGRYQLAVIGVERAEAGACRVVEPGMKCEPEKAAFIIGICRNQGRLHAALDVESGAGQQDAVLDDPQQPVLLHDEESAGVSRRADGVVRRGHASGHRLQVNGDVAVRNGGQESGHRHMHLCRDGGGTGGIRSHCRQRVGAKGEARGDTKRAVRAVAERYQTVEKLHIGHNTVRITGGGRNRDGVGIAEDRIFSRVGDGDTGRQIGDCDAADHSAEAVGRAEIGKDPVVGERVAELLARHQRAGIELAIGGAPGSAGHGVEERFLTVPAHGVANIDHDILGGECEA